MADRRGHAFLDPAASEPVHRQQVEAALQRLARLIAANTTADGALENRVIDLEDAGGGAYTDEQARDAIGAALVAGTGISISVSDVGDTITIDNTVTAGAPVNAQYLCLATNATLTVERVFVPGTGLSAVDGGAGGNYTLSCTITQYTDEMARDAIGSALVAGHGVDITVNDGADTITVDVDETELNYATPVAVGATLSAGSASTLVHADHVHTLSAAGLDAAEVLYEVDFSTLANNTLTNGTETIDGLNWTVANAASLGTFEILNGTGLRLVAGTSLGAASAFTTSSQTAPHLYLPYSSIPNWDARHELILRVYLSSHTLETNGEHFFIGAWHASGPHGTSTARMRVVSKLNNAGALVLRTVVDATTATGTEAVTGANVIALRINGQGTGSAMSGTWAAGWPAQMSGGIAHSTVVTALNPMNHTDTRFVIGLGVANDASPTTIAVVQRLQILRAG